MDLEYEWIEIYVVPNTQLFQDLGNYIYKYIYFMCCAGVCVCATHVCSACRGQRRVSGPLELALQSIVTKWLLRTEPGSSALSALDCQIIFCTHSFKWVAWLAVWENECLEYILSLKTSMFIKKCY